MPGHPAHGRKGCGITNPPGFDLIFDHRLSLALISSGITFHSLGYLSIPQK
jgi:hypothetical protein